MAWTIGEMLDEGYRLWVHCFASSGGVRCNHRAAADLEGLAARLGRDHGAMAADLAGRFRRARAAVPDRRPS